MIPSPISRERSSRRTRLTLAAAGSPIVHKPVQLPLITASDKVRLNSANGIGHFNSATPSSADYTVQADFVVKTVLANVNFGIASRVRQGSSYNGYILCYIVSTTTWELAKYVACTEIILGTLVQTVSTSTTYPIALTVSGSTLTGTDAGTQVASVSDSWFYSYVRWWCD